MRYLHLSMAAALLAVPATTQDLVHYKFDSGCGSEAINLATGAQALPNGVLESTDPNGPWASGMWGGALAAGNLSAYFNRVKTGWVNPNHSGDFTYAFFMREANLPGSSLCYMAGGAGSFRMFTNGIAGRGLYQRVIVASGGNGINSTITMDMYLPTDVQTPAAVGWVHIALVIDSAAQTAIWYINGQPDTVVNNVGGALINQTGEVTWGTHTSTSGSVYDVDELIMSTRAYSPTEILALASAPRAGDGSYTAGVAQCGSATVSSSGGTPSLGNAGYGFTVQSPVSGFFSTLIGANRCTLFNGAFPLPFDLGTWVPSAAGCFVLTDTNIGSFSGGLTGAPVTTPVPIPNVGVLMGVTAYIQALVVDATTGQLNASNGLAFSLGW